ncbi:MAG: hypothetical protein QF639_00910 [Rhodospirillales bacterium]|jgi:hypothetical protein|nr:hypothetical protein [Rhodospirillales bacterium]
MCWSGAVDLSSANGATSVTINMAAGSSLTGGLADTANATLLTLNVDGSATIGAGVTTYIADTTTAANVEVDSGMTLTLAGTGAFTVTSIDLDGGSLTVNAAKTITGLIDGNDETEGTLNVIDATDGESDLGTFASAVGATQTLAAINIGSATKGGDASFASTTAATAVTLTGGNAAGENAGGVFVGNATITTLTLVGGGNATADATAEFRSALTATTIVLNDATGQAELTINALNGAQDIAGTIDAATAGEGKLIVIDGDAGAAAEASTFTGNVGATASLLAIEIGTAAGAADSASAVFDGTTDLPPEN